MTPGQCRAARIVLGWTQAELAERSGVRIQWLSWFENGRDAPAGTGRLLERTLRAAGVRFEGDWGVAYRKKQRRRRAG